jgi:hypothetical protein
MYQMLSLFLRFYGFGLVCSSERRNASHNAVLLRQVFTYDIWIFITLLYLVVALSLIISSLFSHRGPLSCIAASRYLAQCPSHAHSASSTSMTATLAATLTRRDMARRALTIRVLGYLTAPMGTFNTILLSLDPSFIAVVRPGRIQKGHETRGVPSKWGIRCLLGRTRSHKQWKSIPFSLEQQTI